MTGTTIKEQKSASQLIRLSRLRRRMSCAFAEEKKWKSRVNMHQGTRINILSLSLSFQICRLLIVSVRSCNRTSLVKLTRLQCVYWNRGHPDNENQSDRRTETRHANLFKSSLLMFTRFYCFSSAVLLVFILGGLGFSRRTVRLMSVMTYKKAIGLHMFFNIFHTTVKKILTEENKLVPVCPPFNEIICCSTRWTVSAASSTLRPSALPRTSRSRCKCFHKNCATNCDWHGGVISCAVAFEERWQTFR